MNAYTGRMYERGEDSPRRGHSIDEGVEAGISPTSAGTSGVTGRTAGSPECP